MYLVLTAAATLLAAGLRFCQLNDANPWWDEGFTVWLASQDLAGMLLRTAGDTHPPLSYLLYQLWLPLAGRAIYALRFQAALFGVLAVPAVAAAGRRVGGPAAGAAAALLLAVSPFHIWWSQQVRMYALVALLCALSIALLLRTLAVWKVDRPTAWRRLAGLGLVNLAGLYTLYFFAVLVLLETILVGLLWLRRRSMPLAPWLAVQLASLLLLAPWLAYFRQHAIRFAAPPSPPLSWLEFLEASWGELLLGVDTGVQAYGPLLLALAVAAAGLLAAVLARPERHGHAPRSAPGPNRLGGAEGRLLALWLALTACGLPLAAYGITLQRGLFFSAVYQTRYDLPALPALVILLAWGLTRLPRAAAALPAALLLGVSLWSLPRLYDARHRTDDYQTLAGFVQAYEQPGDAVVFDPDTNFHLFLLDYRGSLPWEAIPAGQRVDAAYADALFSGWLPRYHALWLLQEAGGHDAGPQHPVRDWLEAHLSPALRLSVGDRLLTLYEPAGSPRRALAPGFRPEFPAPAPLAGFDQPLDDVRPGDVLHLAVYGPAAALTFAGQTFPAQASPGRSDFAVPIGAATPPGRQPLSVRLDDGRLLPLSSVAVESRPAPPIESRPPLARPAGQAFGDRALLTSYDLQPPAPRPGQDLSVDLQWKALAPFSDNYTVFVHVLDGANHVVAQRDSQPLDGALPTVRWQPGQTIDDRYAIPLPPALPPGDYQLELGLYLQSTGQRLPLPDGQDRLLLSPVTIR